MDGNGVQLACGVVGLGVIMTAAAWWLRIRIGEFEIPQGEGQEPVVIKIMLWPFVAIIFVGLALFMLRL